jgi:hypothetical protein
MPRFAVGAYMKEKKNCRDLAVTNNSETQQIQANINEEQKSLSRKRNYFAALKRRHKRLDAKV